MITPHDSEPHVIISIRDLTPANQERAKGDTLLGEAMALREQVTHLLRQAYKLEMEAFAHYAKAEGMDQRQQ